MTLTKEEQLEFDAMVKEAAKAFEKPWYRAYAWLFGLTGWVIYEHWHLVPAVIIWTVATLFFLVSFNKPGNSQNT